jgi:DNA modification methylase
VWLLGPHRVLCGDATLAADVELLMAGQRANMVFTDPPYNVNYSSAGRQIENDHLGAGFGPFLAQACANMLAITDGAIYICMSSSELHTLYHAFTSAGGHWSTFVIWSKDRFTLGRSDYQRQYEPILYGWRQGAEHYWCGDRCQGDVWGVDKPFRNDLHPTMKPVALVERAIHNSSRKGDLVLDLFGGSGSTLIACERTGRHARTLEQAPEYVDVIVRRWQETTGRHATRESDGLAFPATGDGQEATK